MQEKLTKVQWYKGDNSSCWGHRVHFPMAHLAKNCNDYKIEVSGYINRTRDGQFEDIDADIVCFQRQYDPQVFEFLLNLKRKGKKCVYELDDNLFSVPSWNPAYKVFHKKEMQDNIKYFLANADAVFTTTNTLKEVFTKYNENVYVLPNSIDYLQLFPSPNNSIKKGILWQGSTSHKNDIALIIPAIEKLVKDKSIIVKLWDFDSNISGIYRVPYVTYQCFYQMFSQLDCYIGLAPLTTVPFNKYKSGLKFLEYTVHNMVTVASAFSPYDDVIVDGETGYLIKDNRDWYDRIQYLLNNPEEHQRILINAKKFVKENFDISKNWIYWKNAIEEIIKK
jgi:glycosyltransferase involved in cell wall biosynthesis